MAISRARVLELLDSEEPDYRGAAAEVGSAGLPVLEAMVQEDDVRVAAPAASLVATLARDPAVAPQTLQAITFAASHASPDVRACAALAAGRAGDGATSVVAQLLEDLDAGVRGIALRALAPPLHPVLADHVEELATNDPDPGVQHSAAALALRNPDPALGNEIVAEVVEYIHARLTELRNVALGDLPSFLGAVEMPAFQDVGGSVAMLLTNARASLDLVPPRMGASDLGGAASALAEALKAVFDATSKVGATFEKLLAGKIQWTAGIPTGLAKQLGLPATIPGLSVDGATLVYTIATPGRVLVPAPVKLGFDRAELSGRLRMDGTAPTLSLALALKGLEANVGGPAVASLLGGAGASVQADITVGVDTTSGLTLGGGAGSRVVLPGRAKAGPLEVREVALEFPQGIANRIDVCSTLAIEIGGVIKGNVEGAGLHLDIDPVAAFHGNFPLSVSLKGPSGIGLLLNAGMVRGGGFLGERKGGYGGALQLRVGPVEVKAAGLLTLEPSFALVVVMSIEFFPPIDLSFGFTLNGVGGVIAIEHSIDTEALRTEVSNGTLDHVLFPADPVAAAPAILASLEHIFPLSHGAIVVGPMLALGWGRPISFLTMQLGVMLALPDPKIVLLGRGRVALPTPEQPIIDLKASGFGEITPDHALFFASLNGSRFATFSIDGDIGMLIRWAGSPEVAISAGGFHPRYEPPRELTGMHRLAVDLSPPAVVTMRAEAYFAVTTSSVQLGCRVDLAADLDVASISGNFAFDALVLFSPRFSFLVDVGIGLTVRVSGVTLMGVHAQLHVAGPAPWRAEGHGEVEILGATTSIDIGPLTWGDDDNPPPLPADPRQLARDAMHHNPAAWQALTPPDADRVVRVKLATPSDVAVTVHPMCAFEVRQHAIPLETVLSRVGPSPVPEGQRRVHMGVPLIDGTPAGAISPVNDLFAPGAFLDLTEDQKLSRPSFEQMLAGAQIRAPGEVAPFAASRQADLKYETFVCDENGVQKKRSKGRADALIASSPRTVLAAGAAGRSELRARTRYASDPDPIVLAAAGESRLASKATLASVGTTVWSTYTHAAEQELADDVQIVRLGVA
ncbi:MAG: hypothetical protein QM778_18480 [Myxococcales bacterium]